MRRARTDIGNHTSHRRTLQHQHSAGSAGQLQSLAFGEDVRSAGGPSAVSATISVCEFVDIDRVQLKTVCGPPCSSSREPTFGDRRGTERGGCCPVAAAKPPASALLLRRRSLAERGVS